MVTQLQRSELGCPPLETKIAILSYSGNRQYRLHKAIAEVVEADIRVLANLAGDQASTGPNQNKKGVD
jgi:hypothetical protein